MLHIRAETNPEQAVKQHAVAWVKGLLKYGLGFGLLAYVLAQNWNPNPTANTPGIRGLLESTPNFANYLLLVGLISIITPVQFFRWYLLVRALGLPFKIGDAFRLGLVGCFWNAFAPGSVGGDLVKAFYIAHGQPGRRASAVATVLADRLVGLFGLIWLSAAFGGAYWIAGDVLICENEYLKKIVRICSILAVSAVVGWIVLGLIPTRRADLFALRLADFPVRICAAFVWGIQRIVPVKLAERIGLKLSGIAKGIGGSLAEAWYAVCTYRQRPRVIYLTILMTAGVHLGFVSMFHLAVRVFPAQDPATYPEHLVVTPIGYIAQAFFPVPGGVGGGELIFGTLYEFLGRPKATGVIGRLTLRINEWAIGIIGLFVFLRMRTELQVVEQEVEDMGPLEPGAIPPAEAEQKEVEGGKPGG